MTRESLVRATKALYEEAMVLDPGHVDEVVTRIAGSAVFVWDRLSVPQLRAIGAVGMRTRLAAGT